jgi:hypothetical protein
MSSQASPYICCAFVLNCYVQPPGGTVRVLHLVQGYLVIRRRTRVLANASICVNFWQPEVLRPTLPLCLALPPAPGRLHGAFAHAARLWRC